MGLWLNSKVTAEICYYTAGKMCAQPHSCSSANYVLYTLGIVLSVCSFTVIAGIKS